MKAALHLNGSELNGRHIKVIEKAEASKRSCSVGSRARSRSPRSRSRSADNHDDLTVEEAEMGSIIDDNHEPKGSDF